MAGAVYWVGQDGNIYLKSSAGTQNMGKALKTGDSGFDSDRASGQAQQIADPLGGGGTNQGTRSGTVSSGSGAASPVLNQAAIDNTNKAIGSLGTEAEIGSRNIDDSFNSIIGKYNRDTQKNEGEYGEQTVTNNQNLQKNKQNSLLAAAQGSRGLRGTLASIGALSGDGVKLANQAVTTGANQDIGEAVDTATTNQATLDKAIGNYRDEDRDRRAEAETQRANQKTALEGSIAGKRQSYYQKLAEIFNEGGNKGEAANYLNRAGDLNTEIASKSRVAATPFAERSAAFTPGELADYLAGAGDMTVDVAEGGMGGEGSTIIAGRKDRKKEQMVTA